MTTIDSNGAIHFVPPRRPKAVEMGSFLTEAARAKRGRQPLVRIRPFDEQVVCSKQLERRL